MAILKGNDPIEDTPIFDWTMIMGRSVINYENVSRSYPKIQYFFQLAY